MQNTNIRSFQIPTARGDLPLGLLCGVFLSVALFVLTAIAPLVGMEKPEKVELSEPVMAFPSPEVEDIEEPPPPEEPEEEPPPELSEPPPDLSLEQLEIALNPGTGGALGGEFALPDVTSSAGQLSSDDLFNFADLDEPPKLLDKSPFNFPLSLKTKPVSGKVTIYVELDQNGNVTLARIANSDLPAFNDYVLREIRSRKFSPPTVQGKPVRAKANLPIPIVINKAQ